MNYFVYLKNGFTIEFEESIPQGPAGAIDVFAVLDNHQRQVGKLCLPYQVNPYTVNTGDAVIIEATNSNPQNHEGYERLKGGFRSEMRKKYAK